MGFADSRVDVDCTPHAFDELAMEIALIEHAAEASNGTCIVCSVFRTEGDRPFCEREVCEVIPVVGIAGAA